MRSTDFDKLFSETLRFYRKAANLTQEELAERADLTSKMISLIERGERNPSANVLRSISIGLGVPLSEMIKHTEKLEKSRKQ
jgi:transcriptional regulator with XRE-family HTH domain